VAGKGSRSHGEPDAMIVEGAFLRGIAVEHLEALYLLAVITGLTRCELLGLK
jgi:hypothetical protein